MYPSPLWDIKVVLDAFRADDVAELAVSCSRLNPNTTNESAISDARLQRQDPQFDVRQSVISAS